jgi:tRNA G18 (ribose-2'-O)-methylase SpoU
MRSMKKGRPKPLTHVSLVLHDVRSVINVGAIFRTAEAFGVGRIVLSGYTPGPLDRFGRIRQDFHKAALGAEKMVEWERLEGVEDVLRTIESEHQQLVVLEQHERSVPLSGLRERNKDTSLALVVGNETEGVDPRFIERAERIVEIPMLGKKESLNVSSATAIALYELL